MQRSFSARLDALERARWARLSALERAFELVERHTPPARWPDAEIEAYCESECKHLACLSDEELDTLLEQPDLPAAAAILARLADQELHR